MRSVAPRHAAAAVALLFNLASSSSSHAQSEIDCTTGPVVDWKAGHVESVKIKVAGADGDRVTIRSVDDVESRDQPCSLTKTAGVVMLGAGSNGTSRGEDEACARVLTSARKGESLKVTVGSSVCTISHKPQSLVQQPLCPIEAAPPVVAETPHEIGEYCEEFAKTKRQSLGSARYLVCVDAWKDLRNPEVRWVLLRPSEEPATPMVMDEVDPNIPFEIVVWHAKEHTVVTDLTGGTVGRVTGFFDATKSKELEADPRTSGKPVETTRSFATRDGEHLSWSVKLETRALDANQKEVKAEVAAYTFPFRVRREYWLALRAGVGMLVGPNPKYGVRDSGIADNPGKEIFVEDDGTLSGDLLVGLSFYPWPVDVGYEPAFSWYLGVAIASASEKGVDALTALVTGPELSLGTSFSLGAVGGIRRVDTLSGHVQVGDARPAGATAAPTSQTVAPTFGLLLNLSPSFWSAMKGAK